MTHLIIDSEQVDIYLRPTPKRRELSEITIGDLHGNTIKLLFVLAREGIISISNSQYNNLVEIYLALRHYFDMLSTSQDYQYIIADYINEFEEIIDQLTILNSECLIRFIGDEFADRGVNDLLTLFIFKKLHSLKKIPRSILSNHTSNFIEALELYQARSSEGAKIYCITLEHALAFNLHAKANYLKPMYVNAYIWDVKTQSLSVSMRW